MLLLVSQGGGARAQGLAECSQQHRSCGRGLAPGHHSRSATFAWPCAWPVVVDPAAAAAPLVRQPAASVLPDTGSTPLQRGAKTASLSQRARTRSLTQRPDPTTDTLPTQCTTVLRSPQIIRDTVPVPACCASSSCAMIWAPTLTVHCSLSCAHRCIRSGRTWGAGHAHNH